jgi:trans-aconitate methyltransferase
MPYSDSTFDSEVGKFIKKNKLNNYLDMGVGSGKYANIIRRHIRDAKIVGVEADASYIEEFNLLMGAVNR